jgi:hypothetical protein
MSSESEVQQLVQMEAMKFGCTLMRNNNGAAQDHYGRLVRYGLGHTSPKQEFKSSDLIGITKVVITPDMVGKTIGVFTALEVKKPGWKSEKKLDDHEVKQKNFLDWVKQMGGIAEFINSVDNLKDIFRQ